MKVTVEAQWAATDSPSGIPQYAIYLIRELLKRGRNDYSLSYFDYRGARNNRAHMDRYFGDLNPQLLECNSIHFSFLYNKLAYMNKSYNDYTGSNADVFHFPHLIHIPGSINGKMVVTCHDLTPILPYYGVLPFDIPPDAAFSVNLERISQMRPIVITDSHYVRCDILKYTDLPNENIYTIYPGIDHDNLYPERDTEVLRQLGITTPYFLALGSIDNSRKNTPRLIAAFEQLADKNSDVRLVLSGALGSKKIKSIISGSRFSDRIISTGYISDKQRRALLSDASALVYPSLYEGFGLPIVEAMACGAPVITSNTSSMPEAAGNAGILIDPYDTEQLAFEMGRVLNSSQLRAELSKKGLEHSAAFTWDRAARETERVYRLAMDPQ